jgi:L-asparaginase
MPVKPVLVIHGGQGPHIRGERLREVQNSLRTKLETLYPSLLKGMSALEAVTLACVAMENDPLYNAGYGSKIQSDGKIRMSASIMDGSRRRFAGCVNVEGVKNPIRLARVLLTREDRVLATLGAKRFAKESGLEFASAYTEKQLEKYRARKKGKKGTVGAVVLDSKGRLAAGTSTGGRGFEYPYRVSDSPTAAGNFANEFCAVSATGTGEEIVEQGASATICAFMEAGMTLDEAVNKLIRRARRFGADFGVIAVDRRGHFKSMTTKGCVIWAGVAHQKIRFTRG